jgi:hypothetical protein
MQYLHYVEGNAHTKFTEAGKGELIELAGSGEKVATN